MKNKHRGTILLSVFTLLFVAGFFALAAWGDSVSCHSKWEDSGFETKWGPFKGCVVKMPNGRWLPEDVIREIDLKEVTKDEAK